MASLFFSGLTAGVSFLLAGLAVGAAGKAWDDSPAGQDGALARTARAVAAVSVQAPVMVIIDDADCLDEGLAVTLVENLTARQGSQVLIIAVVDPGSALPAALRSRVRRGPDRAAWSMTRRRTRTWAMSPALSWRASCARTCPMPLPGGSRSAPPRSPRCSPSPRRRGLAEIEPGADEDAVLALVDAAVSARLARPAPSLEAAVIAWAGGLVHARQADRALGILGATRSRGRPGCAAVGIAGTPGRPGHPAPG